MTRTETRTRYRSIRADIRRHVAAAQKIATREELFQAADMLHLLQDGNVIAASSTSLPRNSRFARMYANHKPMTNETAVERNATRRLSHSGNQSMCMEASIIAAYDRERSYSTRSAKTRT